MKILIYSLATTRGQYTLDGSVASIAANITLLDQALSYIDLHDADLSDPVPEHWRIVSGAAVHSPRPSPSHRLDANGDWVIPAPTIPVVVTMRQARLALHAAGLLGTVNDAVAGITGPDGEAARIEWEYALTVERGSALVASMAAAIPLSEAQLDALFMAAGTF